MSERIFPRDRDLGDGFHVRRLLPSGGRRAIGPFVFMDHFGPTTLHTGMDVRPHPHIGLATVTYLFEGALLHRDSLGSVQRIEPGAVNWMSAGRGIAHSERTPEDLRRVAHRVHGLQLWVGLPEESEEGAPAFSHTPAERIPVGREDGVEFRVLLGSAFKHRSPVPMASPTLFLTLTIPAGSAYRLPKLAEEAAIYTLAGDLLLDREPVESHTLTVLEAEAVQLGSRQGATAVLIGGAPLGARFLWWNFVSSDRSRIETAARRWKARGFDPVPGETEFIPLPELPERIMP